MAVSLLIVNGPYNTYYDYNLPKQLLFFKDLIKFAPGLRWYWKLKNVERFLQLAQRWKVFFFFTIRCPCFVSTRWFKYDRDWLFIVYTQKVPVIFEPPCIFRYISSKMQRHTVYLYLETALQVSGGISTHHQGHIQLYLQYLVLVKPLLLPAAIVEELELVWVWCGNCIDCFGAVADAIPTPHSNQFQHFHDSGR